MRLVGVAPIPSYRLLLAHLPRVLTPNEAIKLVAAIISRPKKVKT